MSKRFILVLAAFTAVFIGLIMLNKRDAGAPAPAAEVTNHTYGEGSSGVTVLEYGDFECSACFRYFPIFRQLKEKYKDQVTFQFRHFPIVGSHPNAMAAHRAAEAAAQQGKFWEMHDLLYSNAYQSTADGRVVPVNWVATTSPGSFFDSYAQDLGLDMDKFKQDLANSVTQASIQADMKAGQEAGVSGTPTFFINGQKIETPNSIEAFDQLIQDAIREKTTG